MSEETVVPADHEVTLFSMAIEPSVRVTPGKVIVANLGLASDDGDQELDQVIAEVEKALAAKTEAMLVDFHGPLELGSLFAPNEPKTLTLPSPVTWVLHDGNVISTMASEYRRATLLTFMQKLARDQVKQAIYFIDPPEPCVALFAQFMIGLGIVMRQPDVQNGELAIQVEVKRPDGRVLTVLAGQDVPLDGLPEAFAPDSLQSLPPQVLKMRVEKLEIADKPIAFRAPKLRERMLDASSPPGAPFIIELIKRDLPMFVLRKPDSEELDVRGFNGVRALPVYIDVVAMHWAAEDLKLTREQYLPGPADPRPLIKHALSGGLGLAIGTYRDRQTPVYAVIPPEILEVAAKT